jgi:hypothetical protein
MASRLKLSDNKNVMKKRNLIFSGPWQQVDGDVDALVFGAVFIRPMKDGDTRVVKVYGPDYTLPDKDPEAGKCEVYWFDLKWQDDCMFGTPHSWANDRWTAAAESADSPDRGKAWDEVSKLHRVMIVLDYCGWHESGEPSYQTPGELRRGLLRGAKNYDGNKI